MKIDENMSETKNMSQKGHKIMEFWGIRSPSQNTFTFTLVPWYHGTMVYVENTSVIHGFLTKAMKIIRIFIYFFLKVRIFLALH